MSNEAKREVLVTLKLGDNGGTRHFFDEKDLKEWIEAEIEAWAWVQPAIERDKELRQLLAGFGKELKAVPKLFAQDAPTRFRSIQDQLTSIFTTDRQPCAHGRYGEFILGLSKVDPGQAGRVIACYNGKVNGQPRTPQVALAEFRLCAFQSGLVEAATEKDALKSIAEEWAASNRKMLEEFRLRHNETVELIQALQSTAENQQSAHDAQVIAHEGRMQAIEQRFTDEMSVRVAVKYWDDKGVEHGKSARTWGIAAVSAFVVGMCALWFLLESADHPPEVVADVVAAAQTAGTPLSSEMINAALGREWFSLISNKAMFLLLLIWPIRILVRNYLSQSHLRADARERQLVIQTYLALLNDPDVQGDKELKSQILPKALENIFRHTQTGMVRDDALPQAGIFNFTPKG